MANEIFLNNNEKFHVFSKSPITPSMGLAQAVNKSGHTTTTSDVWSQDIPWFFSVDDQATALTTGKDAKLNDLVLIGSNVYKRNETAYSDSAAFTDLWESLTLEDGTQLYNSDKKHVLTYHKGVSVTFLTTANNAKQASNYAGRVFKSDGSVIEQFVASTDKVSSGVPSTGYGVAVYKSGSPLSEGEAESNFIANSYAGIIQFNTKVGPSTSYTADVFEYVGEKLNTSITELAKKVDSVTATAGEGVQAVTAAASAAGLSVSTKEIAVEGETVTVKALNIDVANVNPQGGLASSDDAARLVTATGAQYIAKKAASDAITAAVADGSVIDTRIDEVITAATLADGQKIADTADTSKLVTVEDVKTYVSENAKVTLTANTDADKTGITISPNATESTSFTIGIDQTTIATKKSVDDLSSLVSGLPATIKAAQDTADEAKGIAETAVQSVILNGSHLSKDANNYVSLAAIVGVDETSANGIKVTKTSDNKVKVAVEPATYTKKNGETPGSWEDASLSYGYFTTAQDVSDAIADAISGIDFPDVRVDENSDEYGISFSSHAESGATSSHYMSIATAGYTPADVAVPGSWNTNTKGYLVTGATVEAFVNDEVGKVADDLATLENKVNAYHEAGVSYKIHDSQTLPDLSVAENVEKYKNVILLVPSTEIGYESGDETAAITGGYVEWLCVNKGTKEAPSWDWEQIGTTEADLHGYVSKIDNSSNQDGPSSVYAEISSTGYLSIGAKHATETVMGVSKLFSSNYWELPSDVTDTAVSTLTASAMFSNLNDILATKADVNNVVNSINGKKGDVTLCVHNYIGGDNREDGNSSAGSSASNHANLWGMTVFANTAGYVILADEFVGMTHSYLHTANLPSEAVSVENNFVYDSSGEVITTIRPERMVTGFVANTALGLTSFVGDLNNLESGSSFYNCSALETFIGDLSSLRNGEGMFGGCKGLTTFIGDLSSLETGGNLISNEIDGGMFMNTALSVESVETIADTLPENPVVDTSTSKGCIGISWDILTSDTTERQKLVDALSGVLDKGWALFTNSELRTMFDTEKYQVVEQTVQPLDLDSEPQEIAYVIKK